MRALLLVAALAPLAACAASEPNTVATDSDTVAAVDVRIVEASARPAPGPYPLPPGIERPDDEPPPAPVALDRDAAIVGRMKDEGLVARFDFDARAGELSLFEITAWGYARGWTSDSTMVVRDADGAEVARSDRKGGTVYQDVLPFVAERDGAYSLDLGVAKHGFRYLVVRHSGYDVHDARAIHVLGDGAVAHEWISDTDDAVTFRIDGTPGERVAVRAEPTTQRGWKQKRNLRRRFAAAHAGHGSVERMQERMGGRGRDDGSFPDLELGIDPSLVTCGRGHAAIVRVPASGSFDVTVTRTNDGPPGLFDLAVERDVEFTTFDVRVGDDEDDPVEGASVAMFREPAFDLVGLATTGADGVAAADVPVGDYTLVYRGPGGRPQTLRTRLAGDEINLVLDAPREGQR